jgi:hypothetical protein
MLCESSYLPCCADTVFEAGLTDTLLLVRTSLEEAGVAIGPSKPWNRKAFRACAACSRGECAINAIYQSRASTVAFLDVATAAPAAPPGQPVTAPTASADAPGDTVPAVAPPPGQPVTATAPAPLGSPAKTAPIVLASAASQPTEAVAAPAPAVPALEVPAPAVPAPVVPAPVDPPCEVAVSSVAAVPPTADAPVQPSSLASPQPEFMREYLVQWKVRLGLWGFGCALAFDMTSFLACVLAGPRSLAQLVGVAVAGFASRTAVVARLLQARIGTERAVAPAWRAVFACKSVCGQKFVQFIECAPAVCVVHAVLVLAGGVDEDDDSDDDESLKPLRPEWKEIERVVAVRKFPFPGDGSKVVNACLVKWCGLEYSCCTWETAEDVLSHGAEDSIVACLTRNNLQQNTRDDEEQPAESASALNPAKKSSVLLSESPSFLSRPLYPFQVEVLAHALCACVRARVCDGSVARARRV